MEFFMMELTLSFDLRLEEISKTAKKTLDDLSGHFISSSKVGIKYCHCPEGRNEASQRVPRE